MYSISFFVNSLTGFAGDPLYNIPDSIFLFGLTRLPAAIMELLSIIAPSKIILPIPINDLLLIVQA